ncbi:MAG: undecaprenyldiphospho-muramoylpentapeptide beta-N-acetylglucosaminyltransferase [Candidatus Omnitrophota bacterium]
MRKIILATGGTGGHIYPALVTAEELRRRGCDISFVGAFGSAGDRIRGAGFECVDIAVEGFASRGIIDRVRAAGRMVQASASCFGLIKRMRPAAVLGFGAYSSFPVVLSAVVCGVPAMLHEQNAVPGEANRILGRFVRRAAVGFKETVSLFPQGKAVWTGNPLRAFDFQISREEAHRRFGLDIQRRTVLVFGGSQGSRAMNSQVLESFAGIPAVQVIHITGRRDFKGVHDRYEQMGIPALVREYIEDIGSAYAAADLVIGRAGAGTVTELGLLGVPALLIPYPGANDHQKYNARVLERMGTASIIEEKALRQDMLRDKILQALELDPSRTRRAENRRKLQDDFVVDGALRLANELLRVADG